MAKRARFSLETPASISFRLVTESAAEKPIWNNKQKQSRYGFIVVHIGSRGNGNRGV